MILHLHPVLSFHQLGGRNNQEDSRYPDCDRSEDHGGWCFAVCDGVGGNAGGEVASQTVCATIGQRLRNFNGQSQTFSIDDFRTVLNAAYAALDQRAAEEPEWANMSTTLTFLCLHQGGALVAHIGDSRIYHFRPGHGILYRTSDHSLVNAMVHQGILGPAEAVNHPQSNFITRSMSPTSAGSGRDRDCATVLQISDIQAGDYFLLCTDGVLHCITDEALEGLLESDLPDEQKMSRLARSCYPSTDNNTAILVCVGEVEGANATPPQTAEPCDAPADSTPTRPLTRQEKSSVLTEVESIRPKVESPIRRFWHKFF